MRPHTASQFFLTFYLFLRPQCVRAESQCAIDPNSIVSDACTSYSDLERLNAELEPSLDDLTQNTDFFAYYRLNLYNKACPFWNDENSMCGNRACAVDTIEDESAIPPIWRAEELSKLEGARAKHPGRAQQRERPKDRPLQYQLGENVDETCVLEEDDECDERDYCVPDDEGAAGKGDYVSLVNNTERYTGYSGMGARQVWDAIYKENCFTAKSPREATLPSKQFQAAQNLKNVFQEYGRQHVDQKDDLYPLDDQCLEQRAFYRIVSGMHASISTHLCWEFFNQTTGEWFHNVDCYKERLHTYPERISNIYFNYALLTRAVAKARKHLESYTFCSGDPQQDFETKQKVLALADKAASGPHTFDESVMFQDPAVLDLKEDFRNRFRNVSRLMDCVGCDKCRLWGKVQTAGYGAALKILFEFDETKNGENPPLRRTELVALVNTLARVSHSLDAIQKFRAAVNTGDYSVLDVKGPLGVSSETVAKESSSPAASPQPSSANDDDFQDFEDEPEPPLVEQTISEVFWSELDLVWRAYKMVLRSWVEMPFKFFAIFVMELNRLWNYWLGIPVPDRSWDFHFPTRDEL
ncbi:Endoplasmic reticulum oxidoreductin-1 [Exophiala dermatitidis]|uniref:ERO1-like protein alpha n=1 Tax=Exophiala dermatitidis (strain ATCC 34100 / CBS 525.76 / NIH/UT8656) TaxID=858893 RepID=H6CBK6_EXODN|nr:ERO1-like protein alpha [Exophiala dermatitidis NIH/UT8656]EHY61153.1 ERO1-like protein alpha [Exophiala dermatitidis NIH/UT8656]